MIDILASSDFWCGFAAGATVWGFIITRIEQYNDRRNLRQP
jgi:hypothetical protein